VGTCLIVALALAQTGQAPPVPEYAIHLQARVKQRKDALHILHSFDDQAATVALSLGSASRSREQACKMLAHQVQVAAIQRPQTLHGQSVAAVKDVPVQHSSSPPPEGSPQLVVLHQQTKTVASSLSSLIWLQCVLYSVVEDLHPSLAANRCGNHRNSFATLQGHT